jgi:hypothetical protein
MFIINCMLFFGIYCFILLIAQFGFLKCCLLKFCLSEEIK